MCLWCGNSYLVAVGQESLLVVIFDDLEGVQAQVPADVVLLHAGDLGLKGKRGQKATVGGERRTS